MLQAQNMRPTVIKIGGSMMDDEEALRELCWALSALHASGLSLVLVHGGGKDINRHLAWLNEAPTFKDGLRVTSIAALKIVEMTLSGYVNKKLVGLLNSAKPEKKGDENSGVHFRKGMAVGLSGVDANLFICEPISAELGQVGRIVSVQPSLVQTLLQSKYLPVISPISVDVNQLHFNVNADDAAGALATALHAEKLIFVSDVEGVRGADGIRIPELNGEKIDQLIRDGIANGGMIPKLKSCRDATDAGIDQVHICGWKDSEGFSDQVSGKGNSGTIIKR